MSILILKFNSLQYGYIEAHYHLEVDFKRCSVNGSIIGGIDAHIARLAFPSILIGFISGNTDRLMA